MVRRAPSLLLPPARLHEIDMMNYHPQRVRTSRAGFFLIEVIVSSSIIAVVLILLIGSIQDTVEVSKRALERTQASFLLEEGAEATKTIRDAAWANVTALTPGTPYYLSFNGSVWSFTTTPNSIGQFTRTVTVSSVYRDATDDIGASGTLDTGTVLVNTTVSWEASSGTQTKSLDFYIANIR